jgi:branched-subunit amino acid aminotransferase/4-amino-4-deoxychorismate lyase
VTLVEVDGRPATVQDLAGLVHRGYGHYTSMQVRGGRVRGLRFHLDRLERQQHAVFGTGLDVEAVQAHVRHAVARQPDASVRVVLTADRDGAPTVTVAVDDPVDAPAEPLRLMTVGTERQVPEVKHLGTFLQGYQARRARAAGFDDALFVGRGARLLETTIWNIGFVVDGSVVFPEGPLLPGVTMLLLLQHAPDAGIPVHSRPVTLPELAEVEAVFLTNSYGVARVSAVDDHTWDAAHPFVDRLAAVYRDVPLEAM